jgi:hypothetical protein
LNSDGKVPMSKPAPQPDMAWHLRRLLEAVKEAACGLEGRWGWLAGPIALLARLWTRRERREAAEAMQAVQGMLEAFLTLIEEFRAGRLAPPDAVPEVNEAAKSGVAPHDGGLKPTLRFAEVNEAAKRGVAPPNGADGAGGFPLPRGKPALKGRGIVGGRAEDDAGACPDCAAVRCRGDGCAQATGPGYPLIFPPRGRRRRAIFKNPGAMRGFPAHISLRYRN